MLHTCVSFGTCFTRGIFLIIFVLLLSSILCWDCVWQSDGVVGAQLWTQDIFLMKYCFHTFYWFQQCKCDWYVCFGLWECPTVYNIWKKDFITNRLEWGQIELGCLCLARLEWLQTSILSDITMTTVIRTRLHIPVTYSLSVMDPCNGSLPIVHLQLAKPVI